MIYHLTTEIAWKEALDRAVYSHSSLQTEGFIHCSTESQLLESAEKHMKGYDQLIVLHIIEKRLKDILKMEPGRNNELFPHIYGKIPVETVEFTTLLVKDDNGHYVWLR